MNLAPNNQRKRAGVVAVITQDDRFLVIRRSRLVRAPRAICFPGGGIEQGESEAEALLRELREELSVEARAIRRVWHSTSPSGLSLAWWRAEVDDLNQLAANPAEVEAIHWWTSAELHNQPDLLPTNRAFLHAWARQEIGWEG